MRKSLYIIIPLFILGLMEGVVWMVLKKPSQEEEVVPIAATDESESEAERGTEESSKYEEPKEGASVPAPYSGLGNLDSGSFPPPTTEIKNGKTERTIHMGVRQYAWDPATITVKKGELVRLIIHNADVKHGLVIPDLGVMEGDIPPEGAVIEFTASKAGTFEFFCSVWCGERHMEMRGKIVVE